uniref:Uncharacterized protein n=2 Tax=Anguilla anguilla TaxID=7936 RepID=A0A0E9U8J5_ANGAN
MTVDTCEGTSIGIYFYLENYTRVIGREKNKHTQQTLAWRCAPLG